MNEHELKPVASILMSLTTAPRADWSLTYEAPIRRDGYGDTEYGDFKK
jgi:hypothetical protein